MSPDEMVGIFCLIGGAALCVFGSKYQECTLSFFGSGVGAYLFYLVGSKIEFGFTTQIILSILVSLIFSFICMKLKRLSVLLIAIIHSLCISNLMAPGLGEHWSQFVMYACLIILPSLFLYVPDIGIVVSSSFFGSWIFVAGIEQFIGTGFPNPMVVLFNRDWDRLVVIEESAFLECLLVCSIMLTSLLIQIKTLVPSSNEVQMLDIVSLIQEKVIEKVVTDKTITPFDLETDLREVLVDDEVVSKVHNLIFGVGLPVIKSVELIAGDDDNNDMVTPNGDDILPPTSDIKTYYFEKLIGKSESSKPLIIN
ncbi:hypothetical protein DDB_G0284315 [Dictyostelium discoideum AX4]|uniref:TM7S3/TM198-like domain-containing protein n=1 Tax=Dictyostelium discoideum TaxID=44689 RepID=Q54PY0_DICDI|nr:hypothetical protein DDB_G0284315 [Dictyostelium discoideum AX4]EAL65346.1 hypothetical protein DDB_G0284315 [Dictyostelium discoideum AX4]|eukprot:XP_638665.1 hypothetical protein DDB_G0284315 [Dictyostelium discoideum AX4]